MEVACWKGKKAKQEKMDQRAKKVGQVKEMSSESSSSGEEDEKTESSMSSDTSIFHIREIKGKGKKAVKAIFELKEEGEHYILNLKANGKTFECLLDTGSPISIIPKSYRNLMNPKKFVNEETKRNFVDVNNNPVKISTRYHLKTKLLEKEEKLLWWEVKEIDFPILGMDNFRKLGLKVIQDSENKMEDKLKRREREELASGSEKIAHIEDQVNQLKRETLAKFKKLFEENRTLNDFRYKVEFKPDFKAEQQKGRRIQFTFKTPSRKNSNV